MYQFESVKTDEIKVQETLNLMAKEGWELVSVTPWSAVYERGFWLFFKKPVVKEKKK